MTPLPSGEVHIALHIKQRNSFLTFSLVRFSQVCAVAKIEQKMYVSVLFWITADDAIFPFCTRCVLPDNSKSIKMDKNAEIKNFAVSLSIA